MNGRLLREMAAQFIFSSIIMFGTQVSVVRFSMKLMLVGSYNQCMYMVCGIYMAHAHVLTDKKVHQVQLYSVFKRFTT